MFNPLVDSFENLTDDEVDKAIRDLSQRYFQTRNPQLQMQISTILEMYKEEMRSRNARKSSSLNPNNEQENDLDLDNLINVS
jgi:hypothetical protein